MGNFTSIFVTATARMDIAFYISEVISVYSLLIVAYVIVNLVLSFSGSYPSSKIADVVIKFLGAVAEPYLRLFQRIVPPLGPLDLSPMVGLVVLQVVGSMIVKLVQG